MGTYIMAMKGKGTKLNSVIWRTNAPTLSEAKEYFVKLKDLTEKQFDELFIVTEVTDKNDSVKGRIYERNPDTGEIRSRKPGDYGNEQIEK